MRRTQGLYRHRLCAHQIFYQIIRNRSVTWLPSSMRSSCKSLSFVYEMKTRKWSSNFPSTIDELKERRRFALDRGRNKRKANTSVILGIQGQSSKHPRENQNLGWSKELWYDCYRTEGTYLVLHLMQDPAPGHLALIRNGAWTSPLIWPRPATALP